MTVAGNEANGDNSKTNTAKSKMQMPHETNGPSRGDTDRVSFDAGAWRKTASAIIPTPRRATQPATSPKTPTAANAAATNTDRKRRFLVTPVATLRLTPAPPQPASWRLAEREG
jgi:hypothetical protein